MIDVDQFLPATVTNLRIATGSAWGLALNSLRVMQRELVRPNVIAYNSNWSFFFADSVVDISSRETWIWIKFYTTIRPLLF